MDTMQTVKRLSLSDEAISRLIDPRTGQRLRPLGVVGGRTVWPMMGASEDDPSGEEDEEETKDKTKDDPEGSESSEDGEGSDKGDPQAKITALEAEKNRHVRRRQEAEEREAALKARLEELEGKDKSEEEKITARVTALESENKDLTESLRKQTLENAFLRDNSYTWHNPGRALALADLSEVEIDSDGTVHGMKKALDALAKSDSYLLKKAGEEDKDKEDKVNTGGPKNPPKGKNKADADDAALLSKYPALRR